MRLGLIFLSGLENIFLILKVKLLHSRLYHKLYEEKKSIT